MNVLHKTQKLIVQQKNGLFGVIAAVVLIPTFFWFGTSLSTKVAQYVWNEWQAGELALILDRTDATFAYRIGEYYFGNQAAIGSQRERPYNLLLAEKAFGKAIAIEPNFALAHYMRARIEFVRADFADALTDLNTELALYPENKRSLYMRGLVYVYRGLDGDLLLAEKDFREFSIWAPSEWAGYNDLAFVLAKEKKYTEAAVVLKEGITKANGGIKNPWLWNSLGVMELNLKEIVSARLSFAKAQTFAETLAIEDWQRAYPGNSPSGALAQSGVDAMQKSIARNIIKAYAMSEK